MIMNTITNHVNKCYIASFTYAGRWLIKFNSSLVLYIYYCIYIIRAIYERERDDLKCILYDISFFISHEGVVHDESCHRRDIKLFSPIFLIVVLIRKPDSLSFSLFKIYKMKMTVGLKRAASRLVVGSINEDGARGRGNPLLFANWWR